MGGDSLGFLGFGLNDVPANEIKISGGADAGFRFTYNMSRWLGHEFGASYMRNTLTAPLGTTGILWDVPTPTWLLFYDLVFYVLPEEAGARPFLAAGAQISRFRPQDVRTFSTFWTDKFGPNYGGGVKVRVHRHVLVRFDVREYATPKPWKFIETRGWLRQREFSGGVALVF